MPPRRRGGRASRAVGAATPATPVHSSHPTPLSSAYPSTYASEAEFDLDDEIKNLSLGGLSLRDGIGGHNADDTVAPRPKAVKEKPFRFLDLPGELRLAIYAEHFAGVGRVIDIEAGNYKRIHKKLAILRTCRAIYHEASHLFYSTHTFRLFPTTIFKRKKPLLALLKPHQRRSITSLELRLGPGFNKPPRAWVVNTALGLADCVNVSKLTVFVECDPSDNIFNGFRRANGFYEAFSTNLLNGVLEQMPWVDRVHFDAWSSVKKSGVMMQSLIAVVAKRGRHICWGPERGWTDGDEPADVVVDMAALNAPLMSQLSSAMVAVQAA